MDLEEITQLTKKRDRARREADQKKGEAKAAMKRLKECGVETVEAAEAKVAELAEKEQELKQELEQDAEALEKAFPGVL
jgi:hypothetical protein